MKLTIPFLSSGPRDSQNAWLDALRGAMPELEIIAFDELSDGARMAARIAIVANPDPAHILQLPSLMWVQSLWAGVEKLVAELPASDLKIVRLIDPNLSQTMAEAVLAWCLYLHRDMPTYQRQQHEKTWQDRELIAAHDRKIAVLGLGHLGNAAAARLVANDFEVLGWSRTAIQIEGITTYSGLEGLDAILEQADIMVVLLPLTDKTSGLLNVTRLRQMKRGASIINFGRGPIIHTPALINALDHGQISHAVLDVFDVEPLPSTSPLWHHPNITILPHISAPTNKKTASAIVANNVHAFLQSKVIPRGVDRDLGY